MGSSFVRVLAVLLLASGVLSSRALAAELTVQAPPQCGRAPGIRLQVENLLHRSLDEIASMDFALAITAAEQGGFELALHTRPRNGDPERTRSLQAETCDELCDAAAVAIALAISGQEPVAEPAPAAPSTAPPAAPETAAANALPASARPDEPTPFRGMIAVGGALDSAVLPGIAPGVQLEAGVQYGALALRLHGILFAAQTSATPDGSGGKLGLAVGGALLCGERRVSPLRAMGCAGAEIGVLSAAPVMLDKRRPTQRRGFQALRAELGLSWEFAEGFAILGRAGAAIPLRRDLFQINSGMTVHRPASVSLRALLGVEMSL